MDLVKQLLTGSDPSDLISDWPSADSSQALLKSQVLKYSEDLSKNKASVLLVISSALFSLDLCPGLVKQSLSANSIDILEAVLKHKAFQLSSKSLGRVFIHLSMCPIPSSYSTPRSNYKPFKLESNRQSIKLNRSDRIRYYLLNLCISNSIAIPKSNQVNSSAVQYFLFIIRYFMTFPNPLPNAPSPDRFLDFVNGIMDSAVPSAFLHELAQGVEEYLSFSESADYILNVLTAHKESFPSKPLESFSHLILN